MTDKQKDYAIFEVEGMLDKDPVSKTGDTWKMARFSVSVSEFNKKQNKNMKSWWQCIAWGQQADDIMAQAKAGCRIRVEGKPVYRKYTAADKTEKMIFEVTVFKFEVLSGQQDMLQAVNATDGFEDTDIPF